MGFYIGCKICGSAAKADNDNTLNCGHNELEQESIRQSMSGATILNVYEQSGPVYGNVLQLERNGRTFWVSYNAPGHYISPRLRTIPEEEEWSAQTQAELREQSVNRWNEFLESEEESENDLSPDEIRSNMQADVTQWNELIDFLNSPAPVRTDDE